MGTVVLAEILWPCLVVAGFLAALMFTWVPVRRLTHEATNVLVIILILVRHL